MKTEREIETERKEVQPQQLPNVNTPKLHNYNKNKNNNQPETGH